jgi:hypothetical protein
VTEERRIDQTEDGQDATVETWLRTEVVAAYDAITANPDRAISAEELRARLAAHHQKMLAELDR